MNPQNILANVFTQSHPSIAWAIHCAPAYRKAFKANFNYNNLTNILNYINVGFESIIYINTANKQIIAVL
jgi:hypothetical protein